MAKKETKQTGVAVAPTEEQIAAIKELFPAEEGFTRVYLPRLGMFSQDITEGTGKAMKVVSEAGVFYTEVRSSEKDAAGKLVFTKEEIGTSIEGTVIYQRKQLSFYDEVTESFISSPIFDTDEDVIPLWSSGAEIARGTAKELKALYPSGEFDKSGNEKSKLADKKVLYVLYEGEIHELVIGGTSMWAFMSYARKTNVPFVLTRFSSESMVKGKIAWNKMSFDVVRPLNSDEAGVIIGHAKDLKYAFEAEKEYFAGLQAENDAQVAQNKKEGKATSLEDFA